MDSETQALSGDAALRLAADSRRREALEHLFEQDDGVTTVEDLTERIAVGASGVGGGRSRGGTDGSTRVAVELRHVHLPKLDERDVVDYDPGSGTVRYHSHERLEALVEFVSATFDGE